MIKNANGSFFINTLTDYPKVATGVTTVQINYSTPVPIANLGYFNPFLISNMRRGYEVHLAGYPPTDLANKSLFGSNDDTSSPATGRYYLSKENWPWALSLSTDLVYLLERVNII